MVAKWVILASILPLALGLALRGDGEEEKERAKKIEERLKSEITREVGEMEEDVKSHITWRDGEKAKATNSATCDVWRNYECCSVAKLIPPVYWGVVSSWKCKKFVFKTGFRYLLSDHKDGACALAECFMKAAHMVDNDFNVNRTEFYRVFVETAHPALVDILPVVLDNCWAEYENSTAAKSAQCRSGGGVLTKCVVAQLVYNCPEELYNKYSPKRECRRDKEPKEANCT